MDENGNEMISGKLHVVEPDPRRRAKAAFDFSQHFPAQVYESISELINFNPRDGIVFVNDDSESDPLPELHAHFTRSGKILPVALYSQEPEMPRIVEAVLSGAVDYLAWPIDDDAIRSAFDRITKRFASLDLTQGRRIAARNRIAALSIRERHTLRLLVGGNSNKEIAKSMEISPRTVEIHRSNVLKKLGAGSTADAVRIGIYAGIEDDDSSDRRPVLEREHRSY